MSKQQASSERKPPMSSPARAPSRDVFLELWATEMLLRQRLTALARSSRSGLARLAHSELIAINARFAAMLAGVFVMVSVMIALLEQIMPSWRAALVTSAAMASLGLALLQERWVASVVEALRQRSEVPRRQLARVRVPMR